MNEDLWPVAQGSKGCRVTFNVRALAVSTAVVFLTLTGLGVNAASFNCSKSSTAVERMICADEQLSKLDEELSLAYRRTLSELEDPAAKRDTRAAQSAWLKSRDACKNRLCIEVLYRTRSAMLASAAGSGVLHAQSPVGTEYGRFWLTYGIGTKVCEAYLERLNHGPYEHHPKCDRPRNYEGAGFRPLEREQLEPEDVLPYWASVESFLRSGNADQWKVQDTADRARGRTQRFGDQAQQLERLRAETAIRRPFRYATPVDVDNDGNADSIVIWRSGECRRVGALNEMRYWNSVPLVLNPQGTGLDAERTKKIFGHPLGGYRLGTGEMADQFRPIGKHMGIFEFNGTFYMDTFFDGWGDIGGHRQFDAQLGKDDPEISSRLAVFKRVASRTEQVCEYWFEDVTKRATEVGRK